MNEQEVEKAVENMYRNLNPKRGAASRYFRNYIRKRKIKSKVKTKTTLKVKTVKHKVKGIRKSRSTSTCNHNICTSRHVYII